MWRQRVYSRFVMSIVPSPFVSLIWISSQFLILVSKHMYTWKNSMLICSLLFLCEHLFTFKFSALMPKLSKENFAYNCNNEPILRHINNNSIYIDFFLKIQSKILLHTINSFLKGDIFLFWKKKRNINFLTTCQFSKQDGPRAVLLTAWWLSNVFFNVLLNSRSYKYADFFYSVQYYRRRWALLVTNLWSLYTRNTPILRLLML